LSQPACNGPAEPSRGRAAPRCNVLAGALSGLLGHSLRPAGRAARPSPARAGNGAAGPGNETHQGSKGEEAQEAARKESIVKTVITAPAGTPFVDTEREFDAPPEVVHRAFLEPDLIVQWLGPRKYEMVIDTFDPRPGGAYRYIHRNEDAEWAFHGVFHS